MPGLSQLKKFKEDILSLGDELTLRSIRGERPVNFEIPKSVEDIDDSEDFILGMPEIVAEVVDTQVDEDLSDIMGLSQTSSDSDAKEEVQAGPSFEAPDLSNLLNPVMLDESSEDNIPDLSMFMEQEVVEEVEEEDAEPQEVSIADMGLEALLAGTGFDEPEQEEEPEEQEDTTDYLSEMEADLQALEESDALEFDTGADSVVPEEIAEEVLEDIPEDFAQELPNLDDPTNLETQENSFDSDLESSLEPIDLSQMDELGQEIPDMMEMPELPDDFGQVSEDVLDEASSEDSNEVELVEPSEESFDLPESFDEPEIGVESVEQSDAEEQLESSEDFTDSLAEMSLDSLENENVSDFSSDDLELVEPDISAESDLPDDFDSATTEVSESENPTGLESLGDFSSFDLPDSFEEASAPPENLFDSADVEIPDFEEEGSDSFGLSEAFDDEDIGSEFEDENTEIEDFDTSEMEGLDFDIPDTDSQLENAKNDFDLGASDDFPMEGFEIPGFSDVETAKEEKTTTKLVSSKDKTKKTKKVVLDEPDFENAIESDELPPNTLSDVQYKQFLKNLSEYPLNVRLAFENLIVQDEFTDDAEFEVIEKILQKAPARQVASMLERMLDTSIPVPRDFEHRTAEEYEAYKKSISYQLRNKIIPGILLFIVVVLVGIGLFNFGKNCIYKPIKANSLYKQGYTLLQATEYPQSEMKFEEAADIRINKKWFYKFARGYRQHKQYKRAETMYKNILYCFNHDKKAGLEYAGMELNDLANYQKAEEIVRREVLDYHINDADGILLLGDVFLEWGTEKDPAKLEKAREQYATLIQLYEPNDLYLSRMMRYFIRSDNLKEVLKLKQKFEPKEKSLGWEDWTELSGYLLDKYYGPIAPSDEHLRYQIEGLRKLLVRAVNANTNNPIALYNLSRYFVKTNENGHIEPTLKDCISKFNALDSIKRRDIYKYIDSYRLLGEHYIDTQDYLQALEQFAEGIHLYTTERDNAGFEGTVQIGKLYEDFANIKYFVAGEYEQALENFKNSVELGNDSPSIRYKIGYIQYKNKNYLEALGSFMKAGEGHTKERNLLLAMANTLSLRGDDYAAEGYYEHLLNNLDDEIAKRGIVFPQASDKEYEIVNSYLYAANNYGVTLYKLAKRTGNSSLNAQAIVQFSQSVRAWDALTRNQETMVRLPGSNLAEQNIKYITNRIPNFEPSIYIDIKKTLNDKESF